MSVRGTFYVLLGMFILVGSCSSSRQLSSGADNKSVSLKELQTQFNEVEINERFDPASLSDDEINVKKLVQEKKKQQLKKVQFNAISDPGFSEGGTEVSEGAEMKDDSLATLSPEMVAGYRVQICALTDQVKAREILKRAEDVFEQYANYKVYFTYDSPYYKVRIGDFTSRYLADRLLELAIQNNFLDAWVVKTNVFKNFEMNNPEPFLPNTEELDEN